MGMGCEPGATLAGNAPLVVAGLGHQPARQDFCRGTGEFGLPEGGAASSNRRAMGRRDLVGVAHLEALHRYVTAAATRGLLGQQAQQRNSVVTSMEKERVGHGLWPFWS